jgi:hypothetical protein
VQAQEAMGEDAAAQEAMELLLDEAGNRLFASLRARKEDLQFLLDDVVEGALLEHSCEPLPGTCRPAGTAFFH